MRAIRPPVLQALLQQNLNSGKRQPQRVQVVDQSIFTTDTLNEPNRRRIGPTERSQAVSTLALFDDAKPADTPLCHRVSQASRQGLPAPHRDSFDFSICIRRTSPGRPELGLSINHQAASSSPPHPRHCHPAETWEGITGRAPQAQPLSERSVARARSSDLRFQASLAIGLREPLTSGELLSSLRASLVDVPKLLRVAIRGTKLSAAQGSCA